MHEIRWTEESEDHIWVRHRVTTTEVEEATSSRPLWHRAGRAGTSLVYGTTLAGRHLLVVPAGALDGRAYVVTARDMDDSERRTFRRKAR